MTKFASTLFAIPLFVLFLLIFLMTSCNKDQLPLQSNQTIQDLFPRDGSITQNLPIKNAKGEFFAVGRPYISSCYFEDFDNNNYWECSSSGTYIYKFDRNGKLIWSFFNEDKEESPTTLVTTKDDGCILGTYKNDAIIRSFGPDGSLLWQKEIGGSKTDIALNLVLDQEENIIATGRTFNYGDSTFGDIWTFMLDKNGELLWNQVYELPQQQLPHKVLITKDNAILVVGTMAINDLNNRRDYLLLKYNKEGQLLWSKKQNFDRWDSISDVVEVENGDIIIGHSPSDQLTLVKLDKNGELQWRKEYSDMNQYHIYHLTTLPSSPIFIRAFTGNFVKPENHRFIKMDSQGNLIEDKTPMATEEPEPFNSLDENALLLFGYKDVFISDTIHHLTNYFFLEQ